MNSGSVTERYVYSGVETVCVYDGSDALKQEFVFDVTSIDAVLMLQQKDVLDFDADMDSTEVTRSFYHRNALGSVMEVTDANQVEVETLRYSPYGDVTVTRAGSPQAADPLGQAWVFTTRQSDAESGLCYFRHRSYTAALGRFMQRDPMGEEAPNLYGYADDRPTVFSDPLGLYSITPPKPGDGALGGNSGYHITAVTPSAKMTVIEHMLNIMIQRSQACACGSTAITVTAVSVGGRHNACWKGPNGLCIGGALLNFWKKSGVAPYHEARTAPNCPAIECYIDSLKDNFTVAVEGTASGGERWKFRVKFDVEAVFDWWDPFALMHTGYSTGGCGSDEPGKACSNRKSRVGGCLLGECGSLGGAKTVLFTVR